MNSSLLRFDESRSDSYIGRDDFILFLLFKKKPLKIIRLKFTFSHFEF